jgi:transcriptional regulator
MPNPQLLKGTLDLLLMQALSRGPKHGYAIARRIEWETGDALKVEEGSMYPALHRLESLGLVSARWTTTESGRRVRAYALTRAGRTRLQAQRRQWTAFARAVSRMISGAPS